jgi:sugar lactone lactonase YvrE
VSGVLSVKFLGLSSGNSYSLTVVDIFGRQVISLPPDGGQVDVSSFPPGIYFAVVKNGHEVLANRKFIIER